MAVTMYIEQFSLAPRTIFHSFLVHHSISEKLCVTPRQSRECVVRREICPYIQGENACHSIVTDSGESPQFPLYSVTAMPAPFCDNQGDVSQ